MGSFFFLGLSHARKVGAFALTLPLISAGCVETTLHVPAGHPSRVDAPSAPVAEPASVLRPDAPLYDPARSAESDQMEGMDHSGHSTADEAMDGMDGMDHSGHATPTKDSDESQKAGHHHGHGDK